MATTSPRTTVSPDASLTAPEIVYSEASSKTNRIALVSSFKTTGSAASGSSASSKNSVVNPSAFAHTRYAPKGTPILAVADGTVIFVGKAGTGTGKSFGNYLMLDHGGDLYTLYAHCNKVLVKEGQRVKRGRTIAEVGNTGRTRGPTGYHLHFEVRKGRSATDPEEYLPRTR